MELPPKSPLLLEEGEESSGQYETEEEKEDPPPETSGSQQVVAILWDGLQDDHKVEDNNVVGSGQKSGLKGPFKGSVDKRLNGISSGHKRTLSEYAVRDDPRLEKDEWQIDSDTMDDFDFFEKGREFQSRKQKHHFTTQEKEMMATYESSALRPSHTAIYRHWLSKCPPRSDTEAWIVICVIGVIIGILAFIMKFITERFQIFSNPFIEDFVERGRMFRLWMYFSLMSCAFGAMSAIVVTYVCPQAGGSGVPEISGILNGCVVRNMLGVRTLLCKIVSCIFTVLSGLPVGIEGPMIHIGAMIGALMARPFECYTCQDHTYTVPPKPSKTWKKCKKYLRRLCRYRDCQERHNLICVGAAAGVAAAFSSPITGLTFAMEEMSTHWTSILTWQTFVACILARSMTELLHTVVATLEHTENTGSHFVVFQISESALFDMRVKLEFSLSILVPTIFIGLMGGVLGSLYIFMQLKMAKFRRKILRKITRIEYSNAVKVIEVVVVSFICATLTMVSMPVFPCNRVNHTETISNRAAGRYMKLQNFACKRHLSVTFESDNNSHQAYVVHAGEFHEGASIMFGSWEQMVRNLFSRRTPDFFSVHSLFLVFMFFFVFSSWTALTNIASGILIPQLAIGALYGRILGKTTFDMFRTQMKRHQEPAMWDFTDPGAMALLGAASFFAGSSRLPITSVVMMTEMTNDINISLFVMIVVMLSKFVGDLFTHSVVHSLLEFKCIPILDPELKIYHQGKRIDLELYAVDQVMAHPVVTANLISSVYDLANMLLDTNHGAFPVVKPLEGKKGHVFMGNITRLELTILLTKTESFDVNELKKEDIDKIRISYPEYSSNKLKDVVITNKILEIYSSDFRYSEVPVDLYPYINLSSYSVSFRFSLHRTYFLFRERGLRHLVVVDDNNAVKGIVTRKDLMGDVVEEKIKNLILWNKKQAKTGAEEERRKPETNLRFGATHVDKVSRNNVSASSGTRSAHKGVSDPQLYK